MLSIAFRLPQGTRYLLQSWGPSSRKPLSHSFLRHSPRQLQGPPQPPCRSTTAGEQPPSSKCCVHPYKSVCVPIHSFRPQKADLSRFPNTMMKSLQGLGEPQPRRAPSTSVFPRREKLSRSTRTSLGSTAGNPAHYFCCPQLFLRKKALPSGLETLLGKYFSDLCWTFKKQKLHNAILWCHLFWLKESQT